MRLSTFCGLRRDQEQLLSIISIIYLNILWEVVNLARFQTLNFRAMRGLLIQDCTLLLTTELSLPF
jgi:hypothetical protein